MMIKSFKNIVVALGFVGIAALAMPVLAQDPAPKAAEVQMPSAPGMDEAMMAKMKEYSTPNENHKVLDHFVGSWEYSLKWWMSPDAPAEESTGANEVKSILGGRFIEQITTGTMMKQPFEGRGIIGFDNLKKEYTSIWIDNMATGVMVASASYDLVAKTLTEKGNFSCPFNGQMPFRAVTKIIDEDTHLYEMYTNDKNGKEFKSMEITYKRKK